MKTVRFRIWLFCAVSAASGAFAQTDPDRCFVTIGLPGQGGATVPIGPDGSFTAFGNADLQDDPVYGSLLRSRPAIFELTCYVGTVPVFAQSPPVISPAGQLQTTMSFVGARMTPFRDRLPDLASLNAVAASAPGAAPDDFLVLVDDQFMPQLIARGYSCYGCATFEEFNYLEDGTVFQSTNPDIATVELYDDNGKTAARLVPMSDGIAYITASRYGVAGTMSVIVSIDDPLTTVEGFVVDMDGNRVAGAEVYLAEFPGFIVTTVADGFFSIPNVPTGLENFLTVRASLPGAGFGSVVQVPPVPNGITDAGLVKLDTTLHWLFDTNGNWGTRSNWSGGFIPTLAYDVEIDRPSAAVTVSLAGVPAAARNVLCSENLVVNSLLEIGNTLQVNGTFMLSGEVRGPAGGQARILAGAPIQVSGNSPTLTHVDLETNANLGGSNGLDLVFSGSTTIDSLVQLNGGQTGGSRAQVRLNGTVVNGTGTIRSISDGFNDVTWPSGTTQTIGPDIRIRGRGFRVGDSTNHLINQGTISADSGTLSSNDINAQTTVNHGVIEVTGLQNILTLRGNWTNLGTLRVTNGALRLAGAYTSGGIGNFERTGGAVFLGGTMNNTGTDFELNSTIGSWILEGTIKGGTVETLNGTSFTARTGSVLDGVTFNGTALTENLALINHVTLNGAIRMNGGGGSAHAALRLDGTPLNGTGSIVGVTNGENRIIPFPGVTQTIGPGIRVRGLAAILGSAGNFLVNHGTISADTSGSFAGISINAQQTTNWGLMEVTAQQSVLSLNGDWMNLGTLRVTNGELRLSGSYTPADIGNLVRTGGAVSLDGIMDNTGTVFALNSATGSWVLAGTIKGGTVETLNGTSFTAGAGAVLDGVTFNGTASIGVAGNMSLTNNTLLNGTIQMNGFTGTSLATMTLGGTMLNGTGSVVGQTDRDNRITWAAGITQTFGPGITLRGRGLEIGATNNSLVNYGTIMASNSGTLGGVAVKSQTDWTNWGTLAANNGSVLTVNRVVTNAGSVEIGWSGGVAAQVGFSQDAGGVLSVDLAGTATGSFGRLIVTSPNQAVIDGTLEVSLANGFVPTVGSMFDIVQAGSVVGQFATTILPDLGPDLALEVEYLPTAVRVKAVSVP